MNIKILTLAMAAASIMLTSVTANAWSGDRHHYYHSQQIEKIKKQQIKDRKNYRKQQAKRHKARHQAAKKHAAQHQWQRGQYIPVAYRAPHYRVNDWRAYHLSAPIRDHEWRRIDGRYVQVSRHNHQVYSVW